jgi:hypothetical protein
MSIWFAEAFVGAELWKDGSQIAEPKNHVEIDVKVINHL